MKMAFIFPGQGSQYVGMGSDLFARYDLVKDLFRKASELLSIDMQTLCFSGPEDVLTSTENVQPAVTLVNIACYEVLRSHGITPDVVAGHSLGEYSALYAAEVMDFDQVMELTRQRGQFMHEAAQANPGAMAAIMNMPLEELEEVCREAEAEVANINSPDQIIITGTEASVNKAMKICRSRGIKRCIKLKVSGAWHSKYMKEAQQKLRAALEKVAFNDPKTLVINNIDADYLKSKNDVPEKLSRQVCGSVLWWQSIGKLIDGGVNTFIEVGPKRVLTGLLKRISPGARALNVEDTASLEKVLTSFGAA